MSRVLAAFWRSLSSQLHPRMMGLLVLPFAATLVFWIVAWIWLWDPLNAWLRSLMYGRDSLPMISGWLNLVGLQRVGTLASALVALMLLAPLMFVLAMVLVSVAATPVVMRHLSRRHYPDVAAAGGWSVLRGIGVALGALAVFALGYLVTLPFWLIPFAGFLVPWFWWSWLTARMLRFDSLSEHASAAERDLLIARHGRGYLALGMLVTLLNYVPPLFLVTPVLSALAFGHFSLAALRELRSSAGMTPGSAPAVSTASGLTADASPGQAATAGAPTANPLGER